MYNFNIIEDIGNLGVPVGVWAIIVFIMIVALGLVIAAYVFASLGIMSFAKKNNIANAWLAFIPGGRSYLIGKLGYEIYAEPSKKNETLTWVTMGIGIAAYILDFGNNFLSYGLSIALVVLHTIAYYNIFKVVASNKSTLYTVLTALYNNLGGIFLYLNRDKDIKPVEVIKEVVEEEPKKPANNFCIHCGTKLNPNVKFCPECGKPIE